MASVVGRSSGASLFPPSGEPRGLTLAGLSLSGYRWIGWGSAPFGRRTALSVVRDAEAVGHGRRLRSRARDELGLRASRLYSGEGTEEDVGEIEAELDAIERDLRRARAAHA
jgi:hypothetical protein